MHKKQLARKLKSQSGISLLEIMLAIAIVVISISALVSIANTANRTVATSRGFTVADQHVRAGIESIRSFRDNTGWADLIQGIPNNGTRYYALGTSGTLTNAASSLGSGDPCNTIMASTAYDIGDGYFRMAKITLQNGNSEAYTTVTVCFKNRNKTESTSATTVFTNWR